MKKEMLEEEKLIRVDDADYKTCGIYLSHEDTDKVVDRESKIAECLSGIEWPISIEMPCGNMRLFVCMSDFPREKLMCPCGDEKHTMIDFNF